MRIVDHPELGRLIEPHDLNRDPLRPICRLCMAPPSAHPTVIYAKVRPDGDRRSYHRAVNGSLVRRLLGRRRS